MFTNRVKWDLSVLGMEGEVLAAARLNFGGYGRMEGDPTLAKNYKIEKATDNLVHQPPSSTTRTATLSRW